MHDISFDVKALQKLFCEIGLSNPNGEFYKQRVRKQQQVFAYIEQIEHAAKKLSTKKPVTILDCACGKGYLSFVLYQYFTAVLKRQVKVIGIDKNPKLIAQCNKNVENLGFDQLHFYCGDIGALKVDCDIDIVCSLHACDSATDHTIAQGIGMGAKHIFSVSCCQHGNRKKLAKHPLKSASRHQVYKERIVDMVGDSMRALLLEHHGYGIKIFEFVSAEKTPKNIMLRATKNAAKK